MEDYAYSEKGYKLWFKIRPIFKKLFRIEVEGIENIPQDKGCIIASNHRSNLDPFVLNVVSPKPILFMAKQELFKVPVLSWLIKKAGAIPVRRDSRDIGALKKAIQLANSGHCIGIFPEGGRVKPGQFGKPQSGVGLLVSKTDAQVLPVRIEGTDIVMPVGAKFPKIGKAPIKIKIGKPLEIDRNKDYKEIAEFIMENIKAL
ncbi:MAG: 1-acyl-sn-glycerol-3-phosphate acyltransferase [Aquificae bacterium]|nr:1-acyl-sn-glycerol-3-phosphate acyltransferase [Aquificota bacterium]